MAKSEHVEAAAKQPGPETHFARRALKRGRDASDERVVNWLYQNALNGNVVAQIFWLKNRRPSEWRDVQNIEASTAHYIISDKPMKSSSGSRSAPR